MKKITSHGELISHYEQTQRKHANPKLQGHVMEPTPHQSGTAGQKPPAPPKDGSARAEAGRLSGQPAIPKNAGKAGATDTTYGILKKGKAKR